MTELERLDIVSKKPDDAAAFIKGHIHMEDQFYIDPASCRYHGNWKGGLAQHSLRVLYHCCRLQPVMAPDTDKIEMEMAAIFHDICKMGSYEITTRNVKKNGMWMQEPFYMNKQGIVTIGHGAESCLRIMKRDIHLSEPWFQAVRWHMGMYDASDTDRYAMTAAMAKYPEILLLQTADICAGIQDNI
jgi:hypothetical protein